MAFSCKKKIWYFEEKCPVGSHWQHDSISIIGNGCVTCQSLTKVAFCFEVARFQAKIIFGANLEFFLAN